MWVNYRATNELLKPEIYYYNFSVGPYAEEGIDKETLFVSRVETILDKEHINWPVVKKLHEATHTENGIEEFGQKPVINQRFALLIP